MKKACALNSNPKKEQAKSGIRSFLSNYTEKMRTGPLTCPICKEVFSGFTKLVRHMSDHCT